MTGVYFKKGGRCLPSLRLGTREVSLEARHKGGVS